MARTFHLYNNNFARGISSDPMVGPQGSYYDSENLYNDVTMGALTLNGQIYQNGTTIGGDTAYSYISFTDPDGFLTGAGYIMGNGKVRSPDGTLLFTMAQLQPATAVKHGTKILWKQGDKLHTTNIDGTSYTANVFTLTGAKDTECYLSYNEDTYIGSGNKVYSLSIYDTSGTFAHVLEVKAGDTILGLHRIGMYIYVVTNNNIYVWQGVTTAPEYVVPTNGNIRGSGVYNNMVYTISKQAKYFYIHMLNGTTLELVVKSNWYTGDKRFSTKDMFGRNIVIEKDHGLYWLGNNTMYRLASQGPGMPVAITKENIVIGGNYRIKDVFIFDITNSKYYVITENRSDFSKHQGYIELHAHTDGVIGQKKRAENARVSYELDNNSRLMLSVKKDNNKGLYYTFICEYNSAITLPTAGAVYGLGSIDFTVLKTTEIVLGTKRHIIIETQAVGSWNTNNTITNTVLELTGTTLTKESGTGEASISFVNFSEYQIVRILEDSGTNQTTIQLKGDEYYIYQLRVDLFGNNTRPKLYDITYGYGNIERELG